MRTHLTRAWGIALAAGLCLGLGACAAPAGADGENKTLVVFMPSSAFPYPAVDLESIRSEADELGYELRVFQNDFDQSQEDQQVRQFIASGETPAAILWWPSNAGAALNSVRQLSQVAPVIQFNSTIVPGQEEYVVAYVGHDNTQIGVTNGEQALKAREAAVAAGAALRSAGGNLVEFNFGPGITQGDERHAGFLEATAAAPFDFIAEEPGGIDADPAYQAAAQVIPKFKGTGIDFVYAMNYDTGEGVVRALRENGYSPGRDVIVIAGDLRGDLADIREGRISSGIIQAPQMEGELAVRTAVQYLRHGTVIDGELRIEVTPEDPGLQDGPPHRTTWIPTPGVTPDTVASFRMWGMDIAELTR